MFLRASTPYFLLSYVLMLVIGELHEQSHILTGGLVCAGFGPRDFNAWSTSASCARPGWALLAPLAGPLFSYAMMWLGAMWMRGADKARQSLGLPLLFAAVPFARILTAAMGGGDEKVFLTLLLGEAATPLAIRAMAVGITLVMCGLPMWLAWKALQNRRRTLIILGYAVLPLLVTVAYQFKLLNGLLRGGLLAEPVLLGTPLFIWLHTMAALLLLWAGRRTLMQAAR